MPKKSPSGSSGTSASEYNVNVPCFPSPPAFSSHSHVRHVLPQIPTRAGHPRMAVSKASTRDPFLGGMTEGESFADVITTHQLDDNLEQTHVVTKELHSDSKFFVRNRPVKHKEASDGGVKHMMAEPLMEFTSHSQSGMKARKTSVREEDASPSLSHSSSPSGMVNVSETTKRRGTVLKSPGASEFAKLGQKESKGFSSVVDDSDSGYMMNNSRSSKQTKLSSVVESVPLPQPRPRYSTKPRNPGMSAAVFASSDEDDTDDDNDSPVAMNLTLPTKSPLRSSSNTESLPKFPPPRHKAANRGTGAFVGSPLDAIMKMTCMINTSKTEPPPPFTANTDAAIATGSFAEHFSTPFQSRGDVWSQQARIFGSGSLPGMSYGKIAAEGVLKLPTASQASDDFDDAQAQSAGEFASNPPASSSRTKDMPWISSVQLQSEKQTSWETSDESYEDTAHPRISDGNPIKLKIRRSTSGDNPQLSVVTSTRLKDTKADDVMIKSVDAPAMSHPSQHALPQLGTAPSPSTVPTGPTKSKLPAPSRAKTKGELKKQLFERKEQRLRIDGSSQASSPAGSTMTPSPSRSHADTLSPLSVNVDGGLSTPQPSPQFSAGKTSVAAVTSPTENVSTVSFLCLLSPLCSFSHYQSIYCC